MNNNIVIYNHTERIFDSSFKLDWIDWTEVKDQRPLGSCWAFAALNSLSNTVDNNIFEELSVVHMGINTDGSLITGGNYTDVMEYFSNFTGAIEEQKPFYNDAIDIYCNLIDKDKEKILTTIIKKINAEIKNNSLSKECVEKFLKGLLEDHKLLEKYSIRNIKFILEGKNIIEEKPYVRKRREKFCSDGCDCYDRIKIIIRKSIDKKIGSNLKRKIKEEFEANNNKNYKKHICCNALILANDKEKDYPLNDIEINRIKYIIQNKGAVALSLSSPKYDDKFVHNYIRGINGHAVVAIGWDDNYNDGAFLCMNSWGPDAHHNDGYFWLSYKDNSIRNVIKYEYNKELNKQLSNIDIIKIDYTENYLKDNCIERRSVFYIEKPCKLKGFNCYFNLGGDDIKARFNIMVNGRKIVEEKEYDIDYPGFKNFLIQGVDLQPEDAVSISCNYTNIFSKIVIEPSKINLLVKY